MIYAKPRQYEVTDSRGNLHKRKSPRVYTHVVVAYRSDSPKDRSWVGRPDLVAARESMFRKAGYETEVIAIPEAKVSL